MHGFKIRIPNLNSRDLFACKWLRAPATTKPNTSPVFSRPSGNQVLGTPCLPHGDGLRVEGTGLPLKAFVGFEQ